MKYLLVISVIFLSGCISEQKLSGKTYVSTCVNGIYPNVVLLLNGDKTFEYKLAYLDEKIQGEWKMQHDTLYLKSERFKYIIKDSLVPVVKISDAHGYDSYLIKKRKLFIIMNKNILKETCYLTLKKD